MTEIVQANLDQGKLIDVNKYCDIGALLLEDCQTFNEKTEKQIQEETRKNVCALFRELFELKKQQRNAQGEEGEIMEYAKALNQVELPEPKIILPREKPIPKEKPLTKWEKFRKERGMPSRPKRSRLVFDPITKDWVPRWGHNSSKKIEEKHDWVIEDKPSHAGSDPFTLKRQEKKLQVEKEKMKHIKNQMHAAKVMNGKGAGGEGKILSNNQVKPDVAMKEIVKKRERKALEKSFQLAQLSTASMGKFDKKISKKEPEAPNSQKILKKKSNSSLAKLEYDRKGEKDRNMKILSWMSKADEVKSHSKADAHLDTNKLVSRVIRKDEKKRKRASNK